MRNPSERSANVDEVILLYIETFLISVVAESASSYVAFHHNTSDCMLSVARSLLTQKQLFNFNMAQARHCFLDASPPPYTSSRDTLDKESFRKTLSVLAARVAPEKTRVLLKAAELRK